jgi:hypothetical protein
MNPNESTIDMVVMGGGGGVVTVVIFNYMRRWSNLVGRSGQFEGVEGGWTSRLEVMKSVQWSRASKRFVGKVTVGGCVNWKDKCREVHHHPSFRSSNEATTALLEVSAKAVERNREARNMEGIPDKNPLIVHGEDGSAMT